VLKELFADYKAGHLNFPPIDDAAVIVLIKYLKDLELR